MAVRGGPRDIELEAEPVVLETDGESLTFTLDDGEEITFADVEHLQAEIDLAVDGQDQDDQPGQRAA